MQYDFLKDFTRRMKCVGLYALLYDNSSQKYIWKERGFNTLDEQLNVIFSVMLYIMEQSLKEESCTIDNITVFLDSLNEKYYKKSMSYDECSDLAKFIVNVVLSNEGRPMYFGGYDYEQQEMKELHISYVNNRIIYDEQDVRRTSYYLTDDGYNLLLGTLEVESNLKLTIQEMIFKLHLEKQSYDKALDDVKNIFNLMRIQLQKIQAAMLRIRRNALEYSVSEYSELLYDNLQTIDQSKKKFKGHRDVVQARVEDLEKQNISLDSLPPDDVAKLRNLREIDNYLGRAIDEYQKILNNHFDLKALYTAELEKVSQMSLVQRFNLRADFYEKLLTKPECLQNLDIFLHPLFNKEPKKAVNPNLFLELQRVRLLEAEWEEGATESFDAEAWEAEQKKLLEERLAQYEASLTVILKYTISKDQLRLSELIKQLNQDERERLVPNIAVFKEIMVELLKVQEIDINSMRIERAEFIQEETKDFRLQSMLLDILDKRAQWQRVKKLIVHRLPEANPVLLKQLDENTEEISAELFLLMEQITTAFGPEDSGITVATGYIDRNGDTTRYH